MHKGNVSHVPFFPFRTSEKTVDREIFVLELWFRTGPNTKQKKGGKERAWSRHVG